MTEYFFDKIFSFGYNKYSSRRVSDRPDLFKLVGEESPDTLF